ncbi:protein tyrosine kinase domain-containing protein [Ditylenchus destructor]|uniref:Protein tyrosine kinase domain-containing protein n=1 Tax=Ditylenchus destructor TaxID=166010 RepID=A0AAD4N8J8_9BILA|nr:protein tyrosine kinase domain-containing protein [Ditylenchus destructor]
MLLISLGKKPDDLKTRNYYANAPDLRYSGRRVDWDSWEVDIQTLSVNKTNKLGAGAFADVFRGEIRELDLPESTVTVKMLHKPETEQSRQAILKEIDIMKSIGYHIHLVSLIGCITNVQSSSPFFIMELCSKGSLLDLLHVGKSDGGMENNTQSERNSTMAPMELDTIGETKIVTDDNAPILSLKMLASFAWQISNGLNFLTSKGIIHCDVAARNVLVTREMVAKLGDFGLCQRKMDKIPIKWTAPEALERAEFSVKSDVWSYGILLHEIYSFGEVPYALIQPEDMLYHLQHGQRLAQQQDCPDEIYDLMQQCWQIEPELRPTFEEVRTKIGNVLGLLSDMYGYLSVNQAEYFTTSAVQLNDNRDTDESSAMHISP